MDNRSKAILALVFFLKAVIIVYLGVRVYLLSQADLPLWNVIYSLIFFLAEAFVLIQALAYLNNLKVVFSKTKNASEEEAFEAEELKEYPKVAVVVASYKEPLSILEDTLICFKHLTYPNKQLYLLDDTRYELDWGPPEKKELYKSALETMCQTLGIHVFRRKWHHAKAGMINDFLNYQKGESVEGAHFIPAVSGQSIEKSDYIIIFDADMNPMPHFVEDLVIRMERNPKLAFVQTPQYYTNFYNNRVARASGLMQVIFFEYICESKGYEKLMIFCGTNTIIRNKAIEDVGGLDMDSVTEDFLTGFKMHCKGWTSEYVNKVSAFGMGPEDLGSFFKQQYRWATGTVGLLPKLIMNLFKNPFSRPFKLMSQYLVSSSYYLIGWSYFMFMLAPILYIFFDITAFSFPMIIYAALLVPYNILINVLFFYTLHIRGYSFKEVALGTLLSLFSSPVFMQASLAALLGIKARFVVTPKGECQPLPLHNLWRHILFACICFSAIVWGSLRLCYEGEPFFGLSLNIFWILFFFVCFSSFVYFNHPLDKPDAEIEAYKASHVRRKKVRAF